MKFLLATSLVALSTSAAIAGAPVFVPAPLPPIPAPIVQAWTGPYVGVQAGMGNADLSFSQDFTGELSGPIYGIHAGYNFDLGSIILSAEVDYNLADISGNFDGEATVTSVAHLKARVGYDLGSAMVYGVGGMAYIDLELPFVGELSDSGAFYGVGAEYLFNPDWSAGVEYLVHSAIESFGGSSTTLELQTIQARVSYHF